MKIFKILYPINLQLTILQLEGYSPTRFLRWIFRNFFKRNLSQKRDLVITSKLKTITAISIIINLVIIVTFLQYFRGLALAIVVSMIISTQTYIFLLLATLILKPYEFIIKSITVKRTKEKISSLKNLTVIGITGSYGKTSVKEILFQLINDNNNTLRTPESFNTVMGIAKVADYELNRTYKYFICEMAAYKKGEIKELCKMVNPKFGILTGITTQHLERFGSLQNIIKTKFELADSIRYEKNMIFNLADSNVKSEALKRGIKPLQGYVKISNINFNKNGTSFSLVYKKAKYNLTTPLFGTGNIENISGSIAMALMLGVDIQKIIKRVKTLRPLSSRFSLSSVGGKALIVNNTFSSNEKTFAETVKTANAVSGKKALLTPGLVELGYKEIDVNRQIGDVANRAFDKVILVGNNKRTKAFAKSLTRKPEFINDSRKEYTEKINALKDSYDWIFLENDLTQNY